MVRPDCDIPHSLNGLAKDLRDGTEMELDEVFYEAFRRGLADLSREVIQNGSIEPELRQKLQDLQHGLRES